MTSTQQGPGHHAKMRRDSISWEQAYLTLMGQDVCRLGRRGYNDHGRGAVVLDMQHAPGFGAGAPTTLMAYYLSLANLEQAPHITVSPLLHARLHTYTPAAEILVILLQPRHQRVYLIRTTGELSVHAVAS